MMFKIENVIFKEDFDVNLYCSLEFSFGIKIEEKLIGNCNVCINNLFDTIKFRDENGNHFSFNLPDIENSENCGNNSLTADLLRGKQEKLIAKESDSHHKNVEATSFDFNAQIIEVEEQPIETGNVQQNDESLFESTCVVKEVPCTEKESTRNDDIGKSIECEEQDSTITENIDIAETVNNIQESVRFEDESIELKVEEYSDDPSDGEESQGAIIDADQSLLVLAGNDNERDPTLVKDEDEVRCVLDKRPDNPSLDQLTEETLTQDPEEQTDNVKGEGSVDHFSAPCESSEVRAFVGDSPHRNLNSDSECISNEAPVVPETLNQSFTNFQCKECGKCLSSKGSLKRHMRCMHKEVKLFECKKCDCYFIQKIDLILHINGFHERIIQYKCKECGKIFSKKHHLQRHEEIHIGIKPFQCQECGKSFMFKHHLTQHQMIHDGIKPHKCIVCGKGFTLKASLYRHEQVHTGKKPFKCKECGKSFSQKNYLLEHQNMHTNVKSYQCDQCEKSFSRKSYLSRHKKIHDASKCYQCDVCGKLFAQKANWKRHEEKHTKVKL